MWSRTGWAVRALTVIGLFAGGSLPVRAAVDLELRPPSQTVRVGDAVAIGLYAVSDSEEDQPVGFVYAVLTWDASILELTGVDDNGPYNWVFSGFPDDSQDGGINDTFTNGNALYEALGNLGDPAMATPDGLLVTTLQFNALATTSTTTVSIVEQIGGTFTVVLDETPPFGNDVTGTLGSCTVTVICTGASDCDDENPCTDDSCVEDMCESVPNDANDPNDGLYCTGVEDYCQDGQIVYQTDPPDCDDELSCTDDTCDEDSDACANALLADNCLIDDICYDSDALNPANDCELCDPLSDQESWTPLPEGDPCGSPSDSVCDNPDSCDGAGFCEPNNEPEGTACPDDENDCTDDVCSGAVCDHPFAPSGSPCGSADDAPCTDPDTCDGGGTCLGNHVPDETPCDDGLFCTKNSGCVDGVCTTTGDTCPGQVCDEHTDACKAVDLEWRPIGQAVMVGQTVDIDLYAVSAVEVDLPVNAVGAVVLWDPTRLELLANIDNGPYVWLSSEFPDDCDLDGVNAPCPGFPENDGNVYYVAVANFAQPAIVTPDGLLVTTLQFLTLAPGQALVELALTFGQNTRSSVLDGETAGLEILRTLGPPHIVDVIECTTDGECDDNAYCNGAETCVDDLCAAGTDPCAGRVCDEETDACVDCLTDVHCDDATFCNGIETCEEEICLPGDDPCPDRLCDEEAEVCADCLSAGDCGDDGVACSEAACVDRVCVHLPDDEFCDDGVFCNGREVCDVGAGCAPGVNPCPDPDTCEEGSGTCGGCQSPTVEGEGCRYLAVTPQECEDPPCTVALLVMGDSADINVSCVALYVQADGRLGTTPVFQTPQIWETVHVHDEEVLPSATYNVHTECGTPDASLLSAAGSGTTWIWGDVNNVGGVDTDDLVLVIDASNGIFDGVTLENVDLVGSGCIPDQAVDGEDVLAVLDAVQGIALSCPYPCYCYQDSECNDENECTDDTCDPGNPEAGEDECVHEYHQQLFGDIVPPFCPPVENCPQPGLDDILCVLDDFADGVEVSGCGINDPPESTDLFPCAGGDGEITLDDILNMLDAFAQTVPCPHPCP